jgi:hypothetical protein
VRLSGRSWFFSAAAAFFYIRWPVSTKLKCGMLPTLPVKAIPMILRTSVCILEVRIKYNKIIVLRRKSHKPIMLL